MVSSNPIIITAVLIFLRAHHQSVVYCDEGEEGSDGGSMDPPMEHEQQQELDDHPPSGESPESEAEPTPAAEEEDPSEDPMATASSEDHPEVSGNEHGDHHQAQPTGSDDHAGDEAGSTMNYDEIPSEEPDKFGEELLATCKAESNYQGDFSDPNESSQELKCFYACALLRMDVMVEQDGQINFNEQVADDIVSESLGDNLEMIEKYKSAITACNEEVSKGQDKCEYAYSFITCGIRKLSG